METLKKNFEFKRVLSRGKCINGKFLAIYVFPNKLNCVRVGFAIGKKAGKKTVALITNMDIPLGKSIGNALEVEEAMKILSNEEKGNLYDICIELSSYMVSLGLGVSYENAKNLLKVFKMTEEDVKDAICKACTEYCQTEEGKKLYIGNCHNFNYGDFEAYVPNSICEKHGIHKIDSNMTDIEVNFDTDLVDEMAVLCEDE